MSVLVTGIGFVGGYIVRDLVAAGEDVVLYGWFGGVADSEARPDLDNARHIVGDVGWDRVQVVVGDIRNREALSDTIERHGVTGVIHLASIVAGASERDIPRAIDVNVDGSVNVFETALKHGVQRVVWASSINVFGPRSLRPWGGIDDESPLDPQSTYGSCKAFVEQLARRYYENHRLNAVGLRLGKVYGFGEHVKAGRGGGNTWFPNLVERPARGLGPNVVPFGEQSMDFHYIEDVARSFVTTLNSRAGAGESFVTIGDHRPIREAFEFVRSVLPDAQMQLQDGGEAAGLQPGAQTNWMYRFDGRRAKAVLGVEPTYSMEDGLLRTINAYRALDGLALVEAQSGSTPSARRAAAGS